MNSGPFCLLKSWPFWPIFMDIFFFFFKDSLNNRADIRCGTARWETLENIVSSNRTEQGRTWQNRPLFQSMFSQQPSFSLVTSTSGPPCPGVFLYISIFRYSTLQELSWPDLGRKELWTVYIVECTVYSVEYTIHSEECTAQSVECTVHSVQCTV